jgi:hypothetical protein
MSQEWGRNEHAGEWPNQHPLWTYAVMFLALLSVAAVCVYRYAEVWTPNGARIHKRTRRESEPDGAPCRMGCNVLGSKERIVDGARRRG